MKLDPAGVEKAAKAVRKYMETLGVDLLPWNDLDAKEQTHWIEQTTAALTAYFDHLREAGKMRECRVWDHSGSDYWSANTSNTPMKVNDFMGVIIKVEEPNAKA